MMAPVMAETTASLTFDASHAPIIRASPRRSVGPAAETLPATTLMATSRCVGSRRPLHGLHDDEAAPRPQIRLDEHLIDAGVPKRQRPPLVRREPQDLLGPLHTNRHWPWPGVVDTY